MILGSTLKYAYLKLKLIYIKLFILYVKRNTYKKLLIYGYSYNK